MKLRIIAYGRTDQTFKYENFTFSMTAELSDEDDSTECLRKLTETVDAQCAAVRAKIINSQNQKPA